ncbi:UbiH/UbiF/VisC/COQ6 family ubiquinone biosynthesis hydroxylase [Aliikangiella sp. IMCC44653]
MQTQYDIVIVGGGLVGLAMALSLQQSQLKVALFEKYPLRDIDTSDCLGSCEAEQIDNRVSAINPANFNWLGGLGVTQHLPSERVSYYDKMHVWEADGTSQIEFDAAEVAQPFLGTILENKVLRAAMLKQLQAQGDVDIIDNVAIKAMLTHSSYNELALEDGRFTQCRLVIGADGGQSQLRQLARVQVNQTDYAQRALVATVKTAHPHQQTAWQRFTPSGPVAFLPLVDPHLCSIVWSLDNATYEAIADQLNTEFAALLARFFGARLGEVTLLSNVASFPLSAKHAQDYLAERLALIGDAAHTIHPLAGQGVNLGFQDVASLANLIAQLNLKHKDFGLRAYLRPFERERKFYNQATLHAMSGLKSIYAAQNLPTTLFRNLAVSQINRSSSIKSLLIKQAMGF